MAKYIHWPRLPEALEKLCYSSMTPEISWPSSVSTLKLGTPDKRICSLGKIHQRKQVYILYILYRWYAKMSCCPMFLVDTADHLWIPMLVFAESPLRFSPVFPVKLQPKFSSQIHFRPRVFHRFPIFCPNCSLPQKDTSRLPPNAGTALPSAGSADSPLARLRPGREPRGNSMTWPISC